MNRRRFFALLAAIATGSGAARIAAARLPRIGLQMRSLGNALVNDPAATLGMVAMIGYQEIELWTPDGVVLDAPAIRGALTRVRLSAPSRHISMPDLFSNARRILAECQFLGTRHLVCAEIPQEQRQSLDGYGRVAELLNAAGRLTRSVGVQLSLHPHRDDFIPHNRVVPHEYLLRNTDPAVVKIQMDAGLMAEVNRDAVAELGQNRGRVATLHVKDIDRPPGQGPVALGDGRIDLAALIAAAVRAGVEHYFIEDDREGPPWERVKADYTYLSKLEF